MPAGRIQEVDIDAAHVLAVLRAELHPSLTVDSMAPYTCLVMRKRVRWEEVHRNRALLAALFRISGGHLIRQCSLLAGVLEFLRAESVTHTEQQSEGLTYRLRLQMSHLREAKKGSRSPPTRLAHLSALLDSIAITPPKDDVEQLDSMPVFCHVARVPLPLPEQPPHEDVFSISSGEDLIDEAWVAGDQYQDVGMEIFTPKKKNVCAPDLALAATPPKDALALVGDDEIDQLMLGGCKAPTSEQYSQANKAFKANAKTSKGQGKSEAMKRPAASSSGRIAKQYQDVGMEIFTPEKKNVCAPDLALAATPPKDALALVGDDEIDQLMLGGCKAPTSEQYSQANKAFKANAKTSKGQGKSEAMKRPAASSSGRITKSSPRKLLYSKEYHRFRLLLSRQGRPKKECKTRAQARARATCEKAGF